MWYKTYNHLRFLNNSFPDFINQILIKSITEGAGEDQGQQGQLHPHVLGVWRGVQGKCDRQTDGHTHW